MTAQCGSLNSEGERNVMARLPQSCTPVVQSKNRWGLLTKDVSNPVGRRTGPIRDSLVAVVARLFILVEISFLRSYQRHIIAVIQIVSLLLRCMLKATLSTNPAISKSSVETEQPSNEVEESRQG